MQVHYRVEEFIPVKAKEPKPKWFHRYLGVPYRPIKYRLEAEQLAKKQSWKLIRRYWNNGGLKPAIRFVENLYTSREKIAARALQIWKDSGNLPGNDVKNWLQAEKELTNGNIRIFRINRYVSVENSIGGGYSDTTCVWQNNRMENCPYPVSHIYY